MNKSMYSCTANRSSSARRSYSLIVLRLRAWSFHVSAESLVRRIHSLLGIFYLIP